MRKNTQKYLFILLAAVFVVSSVMLFRHQYDLRQSQALSQEAVELAVPGGSEPVPLPDAELPEPPVPLAPEPEEEPLPEQTLPEALHFLQKLDLDALRQTNPAVLGWICIPDSEVNYPLLALSNNQDGLNMAWDGSKSSAGSIFLECKNSRDLHDFNTLIYGHYMKNGTMFGSLNRYAQEEYLLSHPDIYIVTEESVRRYRVFAAYEAGVTTDTYRLYFEDDARRQSSLDHYTASSVVDTGILPGVEDHILTLSTCMGNGTYDTRWVVQGVLDAQFPRS